jgi:hypothetical protein
MGFFTKGTKDDALAKRQDKAIAKASKQGIMTKGAQMVVHTLDDNADQFLVVWDDRVAIHKGAKIGSLLGHGRGTQEFPLSSLSAVDMEQKGLFVHLTFKGSGMEADFKTDMLNGPAAYELISQLRQEARSV